MATAALTIHGRRSNAFPRVVILDHGERLTALISDGTRVEMSGSFIARRRDGGAVTMQHIRSGHEITIPLEDFVLRFKPRTL